MVYVDINDATFDVAVTLGSEETENPPALMLYCNRKGTNDVISYNVPGGQVVAALNWVFLTAIPTNIFPRTGQYDYIVYNVNNPGSPVEIERGILQVTTTAITKTEYGTDRQRGEYKGHL